MIAIRQRLAAIALLCRYAHRANVFRVAASAALDAVLAQAAADFGDKIEQARAASRRWPS
ncbi:hypothetical protein [Nocardia xishanensis]